MKNIKLTPISKSNYQLNLHKLFSNLLNECNVSNQSELINFFKSRNHQTHLCMNLITEQAKAYHFPGHMRDIDSIVCEECYQLILNLFPHIDVEERKGIYGYCDCGDERQVDKKSFCNKHKGNFKTKEDVDHYLDEVFNEELHNVPHHLAVIIQMLDFLLLQYEHKRELEKHKLKMQREQINIAERLHQRHIDYSDSDHNDDSNGDGDDSNDISFSISKNNNEENSLESISDIDINETSIVNFISNIFSRNASKSISIGKELEIEMHLEKQKAIQVKDYEIITNESIELMTNNDIIFHIKDILTLLSDLCTKTLNLGLCLLIGKLLSRSYENSTKHKCINSINSKESVYQYEKDEIHQCTCTPVQNILIALEPESYDKSISRSLSDLFFFTMKSDDFKYSFSISALICFDKYINSPIQQIFTPNNLLEYNSITSDILGNYPDILIHFLTQVRVLLSNTNNWNINTNLSLYVLRTLAPVIIQNTTMFSINDIVLLMKKIIDCFEVIQNRIVFVNQNDNDDNNVNIEDDDKANDAMYIELYILQLFSLFVSYFDFSLKDKVNEILSVLITKISSGINPLEDNQFTFSIPLQRALSIFLNRYIFHYAFALINYDKENKPTVPDYNIIVMTIFNSIIQVELIDEFVSNRLLKPLCKTIHFINGTKNNLWTLYKEKIRECSMIYYNYYDIFYLSDLNLMKFIFWYKSSNYQSIDLDFLFSLFSSLSKTTSSINLMQNNDITIQMFNTLIMDIEFIFRSWKSEDFIFDLLLTSFSIQCKHKEIKKDILFEKIINYDKKNFDTNFLLRINKIIIGHNNSASQDQIINSLPLFYRNKNKEIAKMILDNSEMIAIESDKYNLHYVSKKQTQTDIFSLLIPGLIKGTESYLKNNQLPFIKTVKNIRYTIINYNNNTIVTETNLDYVIDLLSLWISAIPIDNNDTNSNKEEYSYGICIIMKILVIHLKEIESYAIIAKAYDKIQEMNLEEKLFEKKYDDYVMISFDYVNKVLKSLMKKHSSIKKLSTKTLPSIYKCFVCLKVIDYNSDVVKSQIGKLGFIVKDGFYFYSILNNIIKSYKNIYLNEDNENNSNNKISQDHNSFLRQKLIHYRMNNSSKIIESIRFASCPHCIHYQCYDTTTKHCKTNLTCQKCSEVSNIFVPLFSFKDIPGISLNILFESLKSVLLSNSITKEPELLFAKNKDNIPLIISLNKYSNLFLLKLLSINSPGYHFEKKLNSNMLEEYYNIFKNTFISSIYSIDPFESNSTNKHKDTYIFLNAMILSIRLEIIKEEFSEQFFIRKFLQLLLKIDKEFTGEIFIMTYIESDEVMTRLIELLFLSLILFDNKDLEISLVFMKFSPIILFQCYINMYYKKNGGYFNFGDNLIIEFSYRYIENFFRDSKNKGEIDQFVMIYLSKYLIVKNILNNKSIDDFRTVSIELLKINANFNDNNYLSLIDYQYSDKIRQQLIGNLDICLKEMINTYFNVKLESKDKEKIDKSIPASLLSILCHESFSLISLPQKYFVSQSRDKDTLCLLCGIAIESNRDIVKSHMMLCCKGTGMMVNFSLRKMMYYLSDELKEIDYFPYYESEIDRNLLILNSSVELNIKLEYQTMSMRKHYASTKES